MKRSFIFLTLAFIVGCGPPANPGLMSGQGDAAQFILQHAIILGGHPITTNDLPVIDGNWRYVQGEFGLGVQFPGAKYNPFRHFCILHLARHRIPLVGLFVIVVLPFTWKWLVLTSW